MDFRTQARKNNTYIELLGLASTYDLCLMLLVKLGSFEHKSKNDNNVFEKTLITNLTNEYKSLASIVSFFDLYLDKDYAKIFKYGPNTYLDREPHNIQLQDIKLPLLAKTFLQRFQYCCSKIFRSDDSSKWKSTNVSFGKLQTIEYIDFAERLIELWNKLQSKNYDFVQNFYDAYLKAVQNSKNSPKPVKQNEIKQTEIKQTEYNKNNEKNNEKKDDQNKEQKSNDVIKLEEKNDQNDDNKQTNEKNIEKVKIKKIVRNGRKKFDKDGFLLVQKKNIEITKTVFVNKDNKEKEDKIIKSLD